jgi:nucleotide-binding universal stress UspA family protein
MISKILVPLDGSTLAEKALPTAMSLAENSGAELCLVTISSGNPGDLENGDSELYLEEISSSLKLSGFTSCFHVETGSAAESVNRIAESEQAGLIVMTTRGRSGITRGLLGSVTDAVISESAIPVYVVRSDNAPRNTDEAAMSSGVIVPLDGSELAETAIDNAIELSQSALSPIYLLRVVDRDASPEDREIAGAYLDRLSERLAQRKVLAIPELTSGHAGESIIAAMNNRPGSVVVMTTRGAGGLKRWIRGSVADWLIQRAPGAVVVVPPKQQVLLGSVIH